jgi:hypothetical protein
MVKDRLFGIVVIGALVGLGATAVEVSLPSSPAPTTDGVVNILTPIGTVLLAAFLLVIVGTVLNTVGDAY